MRTRFFITLLICLLCTVGSLAQGPTDAQGQYLKGLEYAKAMNLTEATKWLTKAANQGHTRAAAMLAKFYYYEAFEMQNWTEAIKWARKGADGGSSSSEYILGCCYFDGKVVAKNERTAFSWFYKAANNSEPEVDAYYYLGYCYHEGRGVSQDRNEAKRWLEKYISCYQDKTDDHMYLKYAKAQQLLGNTNWSLPQGKTVSQQQTQSGSSNNNKPQQQTQSYVYHRNYSSSALEPLGYEWQDIDGSNGAQDYRWLGVTVGYAQRQFTQKFDDGRKETFGYFPETSHLDGIRVGVSVEPQLPLGFGVYMGLFYEYFFSNKKNISMGYRSGRGITNMHCLYVPIHAEWRANFSSQFQLFVHGGLGLDYCAGANASLTDGKEELWSASGEDFFEGIKDYNFSAEGAVGLRWQAFQLDFTMAKGLLNMTENTNVKTYQNKNMAVSLSYFF